MVNTKIIVPLLILVLQVIMKLVIGRRIEGKNYLELIYELPTNFIFLSISFSLIYIFLLETISQESIVIFVVLIIISMVIVYIFRECKHLADSTKTTLKTVILIILILINFIVSLKCLYVASEKLMEKSKDKSEQIQSVKEIKNGNKLN